MSDGIQLPKPSSLSSKPAAAAAFVKLNLQAMSAPSAPSEAANSSDPTPINPAITNCRKAYNQAWKAVLAKGESEYQSEKAAKRAYRDAIPPLSGPENIRDFIACVADAMLMDLITGSDGARLLYSAQVAHSSLNSPSSKKASPTPAVTPSEPASAPSPNAP
jgi:hypothetical protein